MSPAAGEQSFDVSVVVRVTNAARTLGHQLEALTSHDFAGASCAPLLYKRYRSAGMRRRTVNEVVKSWARLVVDLSKARTRTQLAPR